MAYLFNTPPIIPIQSIPGSQQCLPNGFSGADRRPEDDRWCLPQHGPCSSTRGATCHNFSWNSNNSVSCQQEVSLKTCISTSKTLYNAHWLVSVERDLLLCVLFYPLFFPLFTARAWP